MILFLDTTDRHKTFLAIVDKKRVIKKFFKTSGNLSEKLPGEIENVLKKAKIGLKGLQRVAVVRGPGSFVGTRTGVAYANALAWALNIPIVGLVADKVPEDFFKLYQLRPSKLVTPKYAHPPHITTSASRGHLKG